MTETDPSRHPAPGGELPLSNQGQLDLLRAMMERGLPLRTRVRGFSMRPLIRDDDVVTIDPMGDVELRVGEVVAFVGSTSGALALHRVVARDREGWLLRGDNSLQSDGVVGGDQILGRVVRVERDGREVRFGRGVEGTGIAWLSRRVGLVRLRRLMKIPRRLGWLALRHAQASGLYRAIGRRRAPDVAIVEASEADLGGLRQWLDPGDSEAEAPSSRNSDVRNLVAKRRTKIVGFVQLVHIQGADSPWAGHWLFSLVVRGRYRGLGIGEALTRRVIEDAHVQGATELHLVVNDNNKAAIRLYRKLSFTEGVISVLEPVFEEEKRASGRRRVVMRRAL